jgi:hypothetical protein
LDHVAAFVVVDHPSIHTSHLEDMIVLAAEAVVAPGEDMDVERRQPSEEGQQRRLQGREEVSAEPVEDSSNSSASRLVLVVG